MLANDDDQKYCMYYLTNVYMCLKLMNWGQWFAVSCAPHWISPEHLQCLVLL